MRAPRPPRQTAAPARAALLLGATLLVLPASAAHAQFGKLVKRAAAAAAEAAAGDAAGDAAAKAGVSAARPADVNKLEITAERLDAFVVGMRGPLEAARARATRDAARLEHEARAKAYDECRDKAEDEAGMALMDVSPAGLDRAAAIGNQMSDMVQRRTAAEAAGDARGAAALGDSLLVLGEVLAEAQMPGLVKRCGKKPQPLRDADDADARSDAAFRPAVPAGMTPVQFGVMRERVAAWLVANGVGAALSPAESAALEGRREALVPLASFFRSNALEWVNVLGGLESGS